MIPWTRKERDGTSDEQEQEQVNKLDHSIIFGSPSFQKLQVAVFLFSSHCDPEVMLSDLCT